MPADGNLDVFAGYHVAQFDRTSKLPQCRPSDHGMTASFDLEALLEQYGSGKQPPASRVDSSVQVASREPVGLLQAWKYLHFAASQGALASGAAPR
jgi:hypothetical protein